MKWWCNLPWLVLACAETPRPTADALVPVVPGASLELMYFVRGPDGLSRFGGLAGAISDPGHDWNFRAEDGALHPIMPRGSGAFEFTMDGAVPEIGFLERDGEALATYRRREAAVARAAAVWPPIGGAGSVPNDLVFVGQGEQAELVLVRSGDHALSVFDLELGLETERGVRLPERDTKDGPTGAQPWFAAALEDGARVVVTALLHQASYLVSLPTLEIQAVFQAEAALRLESPLVLPYPYDLEGEGVLSEEVTQFVPRSPQGLAVVGSRLFVAYSGFVAPRLGSSRPPIYLPGVLARFSLESPQEAPAVSTLPLRNPQSLHFDASRGLLLVIASGVLDANPQIQAASEGGVMTIDPETMSIVETHSLGDFAPGSALVNEGALWVSSLVRPEVLRVPLDGGPRETLRLNAEEVDSVFRLVELPGGLIGAPSFNTDRLHVIDPERRALDPSPFFGPLELGPGRPIFDGLQVVARRPGRLGVDFVGPDLFALSGIASRVVPVELRKVIGP